MRFKVILKMIFGEQNGFVANLTAVPNLVKDGEPGVLGLVPLASLGVEQVQMFYKGPEFT